MNLKWKKLAQLGFVRRLSAHSHPSANAGVTGNGNGNLAETVSALREKNERLHTELELARQRCREAETALRSSEERYLLAVRCASDGQWEWNLQTGEMILSPRWKSMLGFAENELQSGQEAWRERVHPDDLAAVEAALKSHLDGDVPRYEQQLRLLHKDGKYRWMLSRGSAIRHASGKAYRLVGLDTDVTRMKRVETVLNQIAEGTAGTYGDMFFRSLVRHFAGALGVPCAFITECVDQPPTRLRTLAFWSLSDFMDNIEYELPGTPCEAVVKDGLTCFHPRGVSRLFPVEAGFESYLGIPIFSSERKVIGHLAFLDRKEMTEEVLVDSIYRIFTARAGAELERKRIIERLMH